MFATAIVFVILNDSLLSTVTKRKVNLFTKAITWILSRTIRALKIIISINI